MDIPSSMKAIVSTGEGDKVQLKTVPVPKPGPGQILVKVIAAAQNPSEWMKLSFIARTSTPDIPIGHDFAGIVVAIGPDVPSGLRTVGERVAGFVNGCLSPELGGTFAEYTLADAHIIISIPETLGFEEASTLGLAGFTACQLLWQSMSLANPLEPAPESFPILIWGGSTTVGQYAIQLSKLSNLQAISTSSPSHHQLLESLGAEQVFDYRDTEVTRKIKQASATDDDGKPIAMTHAVDCVATEETVQRICECFLGEEENGEIAMVLDVELPEKSKGKVRTDFPFVYTLLGKPIPTNILPPQYHFPSMPQHFELGKRFASLLTRLLDEGKLKTVPVKLVPNGLEADVGYWIEYQKEGKVRGEKIVYRIGSDVKGM
ncbi:GroES-like protein [Dendrothele bispora CBS 962.96]|uniref:GroES-like protein n=1 Tax=Dendrothele bispora (strain CBS 962.96) TaxID=1314807 RepID=A0A4S8KY97_DENBC|nr:GroES-like protein [Dendrothele bispora CBS 962.96]